MDERFTAIWERALNYLEIKPRTVREMEEYLEKKDYRRDGIHAVILKLEEYDYLNDDHYIESYCFSNAMGKKHGRRRVFQDLKRRGIDEEKLSRLSTLIPEEDEIEFCQEHFERAVKKSEGEPYRIRIRKASDYLMRRGFSREAIAHALSTLDEESCPIDRTRFEKHLNHYVKLHKRKATTQRERKSKVIQSMLTRGYPYEMVREAVEERDDI